MKKSFLVLLSVLSISGIKGQSVGIGTDNPDTSSKLHVNGKLVAERVYLSTSGSGNPFTITSLSSTLDQKSSSPITLGFPYPGAGWQSFTAGRSGMLDYVGLKMISVSQFPRVLKIYAGEGTGGVELVSVILTAPPNSGTPAYSPPLNLPVTMGIKYTIWIDNQYLWATADDDVYPGGVSNYGTQSDRIFETYVGAWNEAFIVQKSGNVGVGTFLPNEKLVVKTTGSSYGIVHTNSDVTIGTYAGGNSISGGWIGTKSDHPLMFFTDNGSAQMTLFQNGNVGIGTISPTHKLQVNGDIGANSFINMSDARLKKDILPLNGALSTLLQLRGVSYNWNKEYDPQFQFDNRQQLGFLAQEVEKILPELVITGADGYKAINYIELIPMLVESIKELKKQIDELKQPVKKHKKR
jgi:hypothetical protein